MNQLSLLLILLTSRYVIKWLTREQESFDSPVRIQLKSNIILFCMHEINLFIKFPVAVQRMTFSEQVVLIILTLSGCLWSFKVSERLPACTIGRLIDDTLCYNNFIVLVVEDMWSIWYFFYFSAVIWMISVIWLLGLSQIIRNKNKIHRWIASKQYSLQLLSLKWISENACKTFIFFRLVTHFQIYAVNKLSLK